MYTCKLVSVLQLCSALLAITAAILWFAASLTRTPGPIPLGPLKGTLFDLFDEIHLSLSKQSKRNARAALCAAGAAALQAALVWVPTCQ
jgi:hypothetical protein